MPESSHSTGRWLGCAVVLGLLLAAPPKMAGAASSDAPPSAAAPAVDQPSIPFRPESPVSSMTILRSAGATAVGLALVGGGVFGLRRLGFGNASGWPVEPKIRVIETHRMTPKNSLLLVQVRGKEFLLGQSGDRLTSLHAFDVEEDPFSSSGNNDG